MKSNPPFRALILALILFGGLIALTDHPMLEDDSQRAPHSFTMEIQLAGDIINFAQDKIMVEDTFSHFAARALESHPYLSGSWEMEHCCEGLTFECEGEAVPVSLYQWSGEFAFPDMENRFGFMADLMDSGAIEVKNLAWAGDSWTGTVEAELPIPGRYGEVVRLDEVIFRVSGV